MKWEEGENKRQVKHQSLHYHAKEPNIPTPRSKQVEAGC